jgi:spore coat protein A, manganese oxidase
VGEDRRLRRRSFLAAGAAGAAALALPVRPRLAGFGPSLGLANELKPFRAELPVPEVITSAEIELDMIEAEVPILPGRPTEMWTYGGSFPGPTIRRPAGETTTVTFNHRLPESAGELTVHLHGGHNSSADDGQPGGLTARQPRSLYCDISPELSARAQGNDLLIEPGGSRTYTFAGVEDGQPERASFQWYHDHRLDRTARNVWRGLAAMWILEDEADRALPLPAGRRDLPLMITDRSFKEDNQLQNPFGGFPHPPNDHVTGKQVLVNGAYLPRHKVGGRRHRLRVLNASSFRSYNLALSNGAPMTQIATESGLLPAPLERTEVLVGPGERVELVVDFGLFPHREVELLSVRRRGNPTELGSKAYEGPLMQFRVGRRRPDPASVPDALRPLPEWTQDIPAEVQKTWAIGIQGFRWVINGQSYDPAYVEHSPVIDTTERWQLVNDTSVAHLLHLHHTDFLSVSRNGRQPPRWERGLKETFFLDPGDMIEVAGRFSDHLGKFVVHCHMLDHEDHGLMSQFEVVAA